MAEQHQTPFSDAITFDIFDKTTIDEDAIFTDNLTNDEEQEIVKVVSMIEGANSHELIKFSDEEKCTGISLLMKMNCFD